MTNTNPNQTARTIVRIRQADGTTRTVLAQDAKHAAIARRLLRDNPAMIDHLNGVDGIRIEVRS